MLVLTKPYTENKLKPVGVVFMLLRPFEDLKALNNRVGEAYPQLTHVYNAKISHVWHPEYGSWVTQLIGDGYTLPDDWAKNCEKLDLLNGRDLLPHEIQERDRLRERLKF